jgi:hypothetical protein
MKVSASSACTQQGTGGLEDGSSRCAQLLNMLHDLPTEEHDPEDPATFINTDIKAAFQEMCGQTSFDTFTGKATKAYDSRQVQPGDEIPTIKELLPFLVYFKTMHSTECTNRYTDQRGHTTEFVITCVRSKAINIEQDVQKLHIITDPKVHYDLLRFCQRKRLAFLARNVPPDVMMRHAHGLIAVPVLES